MLALVASGCPSAPLWQLPAPHTPGGPHPRALGLTLLPFQVNSSLPRRAGRWEGRGGEGVGMGVTGGSPVPRSGGWGRCGLGTRSSRTAPTMFLLCLSACSRSPGTPRRTSWGGEGPPPAATSRNGPFPAPSSHDFMLAARKVMPQLESHIPDAPVLLPLRWRCRQPPAVTQPDERCPRRDRQGQAPGQGLPRAGWGQLA